MRLDVEHGVYTVLRYSGSLISMVNIHGYYHLLTYTYRIPGTHDDTNPD